MKQVMIDLETMAVKKNAAIMSIGAVAFSDKADVGVETVYDEFEVNVSVADCLTYGLVEDAGTKEFWSRPENAAALETMANDAVPLKGALMMFRSWLLRDSDKEDIEPWANGTSFDLTILEVAYEAVGLPLPWKFFNERDYRTMKNIIRVPKPEFVGVKHNSVSDARFQAMHLVSILRELA